MGEGGGDTVSLRALLQPFEISGIQFLRRRKGLCTVNKECLVTETGTKAIENIPENAFPCSAVPNKRRVRRGWKAGGWGALSVAKITPPNPPPPQSLKGDILQPSLPGWSS